jgi:hypothetical protein
MWKFSRLEVDEVLSNFGVDARCGLRLDEVQSIKKIHGANELGKDEKV